MNRKWASDVQHEQSKAKEKENELISKHKALKEELARVTTMLEKERLKCL